MTFSWPFKDPDEILDYEIVWTSRLAGDEINTSTWIVPSGITKVTDSKTTTTTKVWLSGGTAGTSVSVTNSIETLGGRTMQQTVSLPVREK